MNFQRIFQLGLRRATGPSFRLQPTGHLVQRRLISQEQAAKIIAEQRIRRPVSPHLSIYKPQINSVTSTLQRITGLTLAGSLYIFGIAYLIAPYTGWHMDTTSMVAAVAAWPTAIKMGVKAFVAFPFFFHGFNGLRHLTWDVDIGFKNQHVIRTGWAVIGTTVVASLYYTFMT
ncbi:hypothetical protein COCCADRAFT_34901 [Bipolaris zeicola 26-R-13]|uniref:Uncharacterized protein n=1 Tax=Cochliobolus carbonum (strain 26-R-13) TaxID=930089 RepID=W6YDG2_COCC2|nr:uncharacterized protein COCCADRAFT_34901 [Bipolaris zeicola 26-R-13]EUC35660.1 hypothetical protein COCCADRAFT_34901 [Bipolaris zeicola 26-R-13]